MWSQLEFEAGAGFFCEVGELFKGLGMVRMTCDVFMGVSLEVDESDVFQSSIVVAFSPFGVAIAIGAEAGSEDFSDARFLFEILTETSSFPWGIGIVQERFERESVEVFRERISGEIAEGGEEVDEFGDGFGSLIFGETGSRDDEGNVGGDFVGGMLAPFAVVAEVVAVVAPEDDDGVFGEAGFIECVDKVTDLRVHVADRGAIAVDEFAGFGVVEIFDIARDVGVIFQLAPAGAIVGEPIDDFVAGGNDDLRAVVEVPVFCGRVEGEVGFIETYREEELLFT